MVNQKLSVTASPVCLVKTQIGPCDHHFCMMAHKKPQYFGLGIEEFYNRYQFTNFDVRRIHGHDSFLIPHTPDDPEAGFSLFRQSMCAAINLGGEWPADLKIVNRDQVAIRWVEQNESYLQYNEVTHENETLSRLDVSQFAFYIGPYEKKEVKNDTNHLKS